MNSAVAGRHVLRWFAGAAAAALLAGSAAATTHETRGMQPLRPLTIDEVLASSARHFPEILASMAGQQAARGKALEAQGAFDLVFSAEGFSRLTGFYDGTAVNGMATQPLRPFGAELYAGYKLSDGTFPIYEDINFTNTGGALKVGALFALLRDRDIDQRRFNELDTRLGVEQADLDLLLTKVGVQQRALMAYWQWVTVGRQLGVYENLLNIAEERQTQLEKEVASGARAEIFLTENLQNITRRQGLATAARRDLALAANMLSYYYRDDDGAPKLPENEQLPEVPPLDLVQDIAVTDAVALPETLLRRPELGILRAAIEREQNRIALSENNMKPRVDLDISLQEGELGAIGEGGPSRDSTDTVIGLQFSVPLQRSAARGQLMRARAELEALQQQEQLAVDQIEVEVRNIVVELDVAKQLFSIAEQEVSLAQTMRDAEIQRFDSGASDFFLVNLREEAAANAQIKVLQAELDTRLARANYDAATVDLRRLGID